MYRVFYEVPDGQFKYMKRRAGWCNQGEEYATLHGARQVKISKQADFPSMTFVVVDMDKCEPVPDEA